VEKYSEEKYLPQALYRYTVKPVLRGPLGTEKKWSYKTGDLLKEVQFI
jgi:hypothetical protein